MDARRRLLDDLAKLATSAVGVVQGASREAEELVRQRLDRVIDRMELVGREEFEAVKAMAQAAREENERLAARIAELEGGLAARKPAGKAAAKRPAGKAAVGKRAAKPRAPRKRAATKRS